jgi:hypothetical protein
MLLRRDGGVIWWVGFGMKEKERRGQTKTPGGKPPGATTRFSISVLNTKEAANLRRGCAAAVGRSSHNVVPAWHEPGHGNVFHHVMAGRAAIALAARVRPGHPDCVGTVRP